MADKIQPILDLKKKNRIQPGIFVAIWMHQNIRTLFHQVDFEVYLRWVMISIGTC